MNGLEVARLYVSIAEPLLEASHGVPYVAVFLSPDPEAISDRPELFPLLRASYVLSLLERSHWACIATVSRNHRWLSGVVMSKEAGNLLSFSASLRGFLEAASDSYDVLQFLPQSLLEARDFIYRSLHSPATVERELGLSAIEDRLIHFAFARKQAKGGKFLPNHQPKPNADYIRQIQKIGVDGASDLYAELCELTHPASPSLDCFLDSENSSYTLNFSKDEEAIASILRRYDETITGLAMHSFNPALACLAFLARLAPGWPAPSDASLQGIPYAVKNIPHFDQLAVEIGSPHFVWSIQNLLRSQSVE